MERGERKKWMSRKERKRERRKEVWKEGKCKRTKEKDKMKEKRGANATATGADLQGSLSGGEVDHLLRYVRVEVQHLVTLYGRGKENSVFPFGRYNFFAVGSYTNVSAHKVESRVGPAANHADRVYVCKCLTTTAEKVRSKNKIKT
jgi:hypothetical protein